MVCHICIRCIAFTNQTIIASCVLHNFCIDATDLWDDENDDDFPIRDGNADFCRSERFFKGISLEYVNTWKVFKDSVKKETVPVSKFM